MIDNILNSQIKYRKELVKHFQEELNKCIKKAEAYRQIVEISEKQIKALEPSRETTDNKILVVDYSYLSPEYKFDTSDETREFLEERYNCKVLLIDSSRSNLDGASTNNTNPPIYFA